VRRFSQRTSFHHQYSSDEITFEPDSFDKGLLKVKAKKDKINETDQEIEAK
jgi:gamma-glutamyltranspeptidase/glutathione hydrolase